MAAAPLLVSISNEIVAVHFQINEEPGSGIIRIFASTPFPSVP
jgi:hypothetical protein